MESLPKFTNLSFPRTGESRLISTVSAFLGMTVIKLSRFSKSFALS